MFPMSRLLVALLPLFALVLIAAEGDTPPLLFEGTSVTVVLVVVSALRSSGLLAGSRKQLAGIVGLILGVLIGVGWSLADPGALGGMFFGALQGLLAGASAVGLHSASKNANEALST